MKFFLFSLVMISIALALIPTLIYAVLKVAGWLLHFNVHYKPFGYATLGLVALWIVLAIYGNRWGRFRHETKTVALTFARIPKSFDGYKVVHLSDFHLDGWQGREERMQTIVDEINAMRPDAIFFTGDIISL